MAQLMIPVYTQDDSTPEPVAVHGSLARPGIGETWVPVVSVMPSAAATITVQCVELLTDTDVAWQLRVGGQLLQPSWAEPDGGQSLAVADRDAVSVTDGTVIASGLCASTTNAGTAVKAVVPGTVVPQYVGAGVPVTLAVRRVAGTGGTVSVVVMWSESA